MTTSPVVGLRLSVMRRTTGLPVLARNSCARARMSDRDRSSWACLVRVTALPNLASRRR
jgi:hypothetical protein